MQASNFRGPHSSHFLSLSKQGRGESPIFGFPRETMAVQRHSSAVFSVCASGTHPIPGCREAKKRERLSLRHRPKKRQRRRRVGAQRSRPDNPPTVPAPNTQAPGRNHRNCSLRLYPACYFNKFDKCFNSLRTISALALGKCTLMGEASLP